MIANRVREETSSLASVRRRNPITWRTNQSFSLALRVASAASTLSVSPRVLKIHVPISSSFVRSIRTASSSSRAIASGHHASPAAWIASMPEGISFRGAKTVTVAVRAFRSITASTLS